MHQGTSWGFYPGSLPRKKFQDFPKSLGSFQPGLWTCVEIGDLLLLGTKLVRSFSV